MTTVAMWCARRRWWVIGAWVVMTVLLLGGARMAGAGLDDDVSVPGSDSATAATLLGGGDADSDGQRTSSVLVVGPETASAQVDEFVTDLRAVQGVDSAEVAGSRPAVDGAGVATTLTVRSARDVDTAGVDDALMTARESGLQVGVGSPLARDLDPGLTSHLAEVIGIAVAVLVLMLTLRSVAAAAIPLVNALLGVGAGLGALRLLDQVVAVPAVVPTLATMLGLGVGIDYALFQVWRSRQELARGADRATVAAATARHTGIAVAFAGVTVAVAICALAITGVGFITWLGFGTAAVVVVVLGASLTLVPALVAVAGPRLSSRAERRAGAGATGVAPTSAATTEAAPTAAAAAGTPHHGMSWAGLAARVAARPWRWAVGSTLLLAIIAVPALSLQLGVASDGERAAGSERRIGHDLLVAQQGPGAAAPLTVAIEVTGDPVVDPTTDPRVAAAIGALGDVDGVVSVGAPRSVSPSVVRTSVITEYDASDPLLGSTLRAAREVEVPDGVSVHVGGSVAVLTDLSDRIGERLGWLVLGTVTVASLLLWLAFGAPGVALKAAAMDLVSVAAAYGVVVAVFQWGWGVSLLGLDGPVAIEAHVPMMLFAVLFGLSMDYEVFLLSAVAEHRRAGAAARAAVVAGVAETAKVITAAAAIMVAVFCAFVLVDDPTIKVFGVGLAAAVAIDATVVRVLLGPAVMSIAGERLWWSRRRPRQAEVVTPVVEPDSVVV